MNKKLKGPLIPGKDRIHIRDFYRGKVLLITGCTGFIGKVMLEKLIRSCPDIGRIYVIIRQREGITLEQRLKKEIFDSIMFKECFYRHPELEHIAKTKIIAVSGNIGVENIGMDPEVSARLQEEIDVVISCAASVLFSVPLLTLMKSNYFGPLMLLDFTKKCKHAKVFCQVSTTGVNSHKPHYSFCEEEITEKADPDEIVDKIMNENPEHVAANEADIMQPWANSYTFCKNLVERAIRKHRGHIKTIIVRPPATSACYNEPMPGWIDSLSAGGITAFPMALGVRRHFFIGPGNIWIMPGDIVSNGILVACAYCDALPNDDTSVVATCLSSVNPILFT
jgi:nucleoside-diphosphate-sugar epimerase